MKELLDAIRTSDDDQPRLVYADWLEQHGHIDRANLIRHQCTVAAHRAWDLDRIAAQWEVDHLLADHAAMWRAELPQLEGVTWLAFERGFVTSVGIDVPETLYKHEGAIRAAAPVDKVVLAKLEEPTPAPDDLDWLRTLRLTQYYRMKPHASASLLDRAPVLELGEVHNHFGDVFAHRNLPFERLIVDGEHPVGGVIANVLAANVSLTPNLRELRIGTTFIDQNTGYFEDPTMKPEGAQAVAALQLAHLEVLNVALQRIENAGLKALVESMPALRELDCSACEIRSLEALNAPGAPLVRLVANGNRIASPGVTVLLTSPRAAAIESLALDTCEVTSTVVNALVKAPCWQTLRELDLSRNPLGVRTAQLFVAAPRPAHLHTLKLADCEFSEETAEQFATCAWLDQIVVADFSAQAVAQGALHPSLRVLSLVGSRGALDLTEIWAHAISLDLSATAIAISHAPMLQMLRVANRALTLAELNEILTFPRLRLLDLAGSTFDDREGALDALRRCNAQTIDLRRWELSMEELLAIAHSPLARRVKMHGKPWTFPKEKREELDKLLGKNWYYHADDPQEAEED